MGKTIRIAEDVVYYTAKFIFTKAAVCNPRERFSIQRASGKLSALEHTNVRGQRGNPCTADGHVMAQALLKAHVGVLTNVTHAR